MSYHNCQYSITKEYAQHLMGINPRQVRVVITQIGKHSPKPRYVKHYFLNK